MEASVGQIRQEFEAKLAEQMDDVLDQVDDKIGKMYETIEQKLKHVSKSFAGKFDYYEDNFKESKNQIEAMFLKVAEETNSVKDSESMQES